MVVVAHPREDSFTAALAAALMRGLREAGHTIDLANLYAEGFDPLVTEAEMQSWRQHTVPADVAAYQARLRQAEALLLIYPVWWGTPPAILVGWMQRVLTSGFAFGFEHGRARGLLPIPVQIIATLGSRTREDVDLEAQYFDWIEGVLKYCGMQVLPHLDCWGVHGGSRPALLEHYLEQAYAAGQVLSAAQAT